MIGLNSQFEQEIWNYLYNTHKDIILYGMGDGADKIISVLESGGISPKDFMASDEFVRGHSFKGIRVKKFSEIQSLYKDFLILIAFGTNSSKVIEIIDKLGEEYEVYSPHVPVVGGGLFDYEYITENREKIQQVYSILADDESREVLDNLIKYRISGKISYLKNATSLREEALELLNLGSEETLVDLGAYNGDTVEEFIHEVGGRFAKIYAVEPDAKNYMKLRRRLYMLSPEIFTALNVGSWSHDTKLDFTSRGGRNSRINGKRGETPMRSVDSILAGQPASLIKFDVEGSESQALKGCKETIINHRPKLIMSLYHRTEDLIELPLEIHKLHSGYKLHLRHHQYIPDWDTYLYCV